MTKVIAGVIPCAGRSRRMGADKATLDAGGVTFLAVAIRALAAACDPVIVVIEAHRTDLAAIAASEGARSIINPDATRGPISSLCAALASDEAWDAICVLPVDHPGVDRSSVQQVAEAFQEADPDDVQIVVASHSGATGHPTVFARSVFPELLDPALEGGARTVVHRDPARVLRLELDDPGVGLDLDDPDSWAAALVTGRLAPPSSLDLARVAELTLAAVEGGREALIYTRLEPLPPQRMMLVASADRATLTSHGSLGSIHLDAAARERGLALLAGRIPEGDIEVAGERLYIEVHRPRPELVIVGAGHISLPLADVGAVLGFDVRVLDDRPEFAQADRFADEVDVQHVDFAQAFAGVSIGPLTHVVLVTRGHKYDYECLVQLLQGEVMPRYIGLIGSRRRVRATFVRLLEEGLDRERIAAVRAPVGLDLGAETPGEIAVAVGAEIVREWRGGTGDPLREQERILERFFKED